MSRGRPSKDPILPDLVNLEEREDGKKVTSLRILYPSEEKKLKKKLEEKGYSSISEWVREEAKKVILDQDLRERKEELERKLNNKQKDIKELKGEIEEIEEQLEDQESKFKEISEDIKEDIKELHRKNKVIDSEAAMPFINRTSHKYDIKWSDKKKARLILVRKSDKCYSGKINLKELAESVLEEWDQEDLIIYQEGLNG
ncbi:MAG: hypothetical protein ACOC5T_09615 [Elusimicrobiota bacterium]